MKKVLLTLSALAVSLAGTPAAFAESQTAVKSEANYQAQAINYTFSAGLGEPQPGPGDAFNYQFWVNSPSQIKVVATQKSTKTPLIVYDIMTSTDGGKTWVDSGVDGVSFTGNSTVTYAPKQTLQPGFYMFLLKNYGSRYTKVDGTLSVLPLP
ncbi:hypothetical protein [Brevibacillus brevis]|uniref:hypothetical protein n=1 Tax=Brevibacillus brevis TaxID=1393 RepID=UPI0025A59421|nr:hypothetical protein [Brevibacillus brevis]WJQ82786.1 hypothetical protein QN310_06535 [Brevibacillus brevis]